MERAKLAPHYLCMGECPSGNDVTPISAEERLLPFLPEIPILRWDHMQRPKWNVSWLQLLRMILEFHAAENVEQLSSIVRYYS